MFLPYSQDEWFNTEKGNHYSLSSPVQFDRFECESAATVEIHANSNKSLKIVPLQICSMSTVSLPGTQTDEHLELSIFADVSGCAVDGPHEATEVTDSGLPVFIWSHLTLLCAFKIHLCLFCWNKMKFEHWLFIYTRHRKSVHRYNNKRKIIFQRQE